ncbi:ring-cleaving dioxygenase [Paenibacillus sp. L3-i20]|uniref:ring-cleaving dioxygenase n=1 Tax=Paenibacillus sp. L3-i20 TaxID=2905833 RepID=UPI001EDCE000|nr:ring-cleaving dioxygenase [Paenibacillus sp. L3-i20]
MYLKGIHHASAITANGLANFDFYTKVLGLRLVKKTVNQDDTSMYHLFYGDGKGNPGTKLTFFEMPMATKSSEGVGSVSALSLRVKDDHALKYWQSRLAQFNVEHDQIIVRAGRNTLAFRDGEGQRFILVSDEGNSGIAAGEPWVNSPVPSESAILGLGPVHLTVQNHEPTALVLTGLLGFREKGKYASTIKDQPDIIVYETGEGGTGAEVHIEERHDLTREVAGYGGVHHVAFRVENDEELRDWIEQLNRVRMPNSGFVDRFYFHSLYFREPNGILLELATDGPGFETDEDLEHLGETLALPAFLEPHRLQIESVLRPINTRHMQY